MKYIWKTHYILTIITYITISFPYQCKSQILNPSNTQSRQLDSLLQDYAYRAFDHPRTGVTYIANPPSNLTGIKLSIIRLKCGSLLKRGVKDFNEFEIPVGVMVQPYVMRLAFVYHNLGNWSSRYYPLQGFTYLTPVIGLLAYNAANISATNLNELDVIASKSPITIKFQVVKSIPSGFIPKCVWFDLDGLPEFRDLISENVCSTYRQGHFSIVVNTTELAPSPSPSPSAERHHEKSRVWKIVVVVVCGFIGLVLLSLLLLCVYRYCKNKQVAEMEQRSELGESLQMARVGPAQAPVALGSRTQPVLESEYLD